MEVVPFCQYVARVSGRSESVSRRLLLRRLFMMRRHFIYDDGDDDDSDDHDVDDDHDDHDDGGFDEDALAPTRHSTYIEFHQDVGGGGMTWQTSSRASP